MKSYAGIGSRNTPDDVLEYFYRMGHFLANKGFTLRSGGAQGADKAFEHGCDKASGRKEIYLPWGNFEDSDSKFVVSNVEAYNIAERFHPYWHNLSVGARKLQSRNVHQVLGWDLWTPSKFILCWTKSSKGEGGTGQAIRIANHYNVPVFDAGAYKSVGEIGKQLKEFLINTGEFTREELGG